MTTEKNKTRKARLTEADIDVIRLLKQCGKSTSDIAKYIGVNSSTVRWFNNPNSYPYVPRNQYDAQRKAYKAMEEKEKEEQERKAKEEMVSSIPAPYDELASIVLEINELLHRAINIIKGDK